MCNLWNLSLNYGLFWKVNASAIFLYSIEFYTSEIFFYTTELKKCKSFPKVFLYTIELKTFNIMGLRTSDIL